MPAMRVSNGRCSIVGRQHLARDLKRPHRIAAERLGFGDPGLGKLGVRVHSEPAKLRHRRLEHRQHPRGTGRVAPPGGPGGRSTYASACTLAGSAPDTSALLQMCLGVVEVALIGQDLADVAVGEGGMSGPPGTLRAHGRAVRYSSTASSQRPSPVGEPAEVVQHD